MRWIASLLMSVSPGAAGSKAVQIRLTVIHRELDPHGQAIAHLVGAPFVAATAFLVRLLLGTRWRGLFGWLFFLHRLRLDRRDLIQIVRRCNQLGMQRLGMSLWR